MLHKPNPAKRLVVVGTSGSGKSTLAKKIAEVLGIPRVEIDALHWGPAWTSLATDDLRKRLDEATRGPDWVVDGNYGKVRDVAWAKADTVVWLDYPFPLVFYRALKRTVRRVATKEKLWAGNTESVRLAFFSKDSILWWVVTTYRKRKREYPELFRRAENRHLKVVHCKSPRDAENYLAALANDFQKASKPESPP